MQRYEFVEGSSAKFWEIDLAGKGFTVRFGKIGASGQTQIKTFASAAIAKTEHDKLIAQKTKKGYAAVGGASARKASTKKPAAAKATSKTTPKTAKTTATKSTASKPAAKVAAPAASAGQYFEFVGGGSKKFWEISLDGTSYTTRFGKIGTGGQTSTKSCKSAGDARAEYDKLVAEKTKKGYKLVRGEPPARPTAHHARNAKLEAAIAANPDAADAYLVYADWLQSEGDPRGELIVLQHANKKAAAQKLLERNREHFFGKAADCLDMLEPGYNDGTPTTWRDGYLEALWISTKHARYDSELPDVAVAEVLGGLLDHPSALFLRELTVGIVTFEGNSYDGIAQVIGKRKLPHLRKLFLGDFHSEETELNWSDAGKLDPLYRAVPNLETLIVRSGSMVLGKLDLPKLRELIVITGGLDRGSLKSVCTAKWPKLERLNLQLGRQYRDKITIKDLQPIFDGKAFPEVRHLGLGNSESTDEIARGLASSKIAAQLETLDLSKATMGDDGALALAAAKFPKLISIDVSENYLTKAGLEALAKIGKVISKSRRREAQRDDGGDPDDRYIAAYE